MPATGTAVLAVRNVDHLPSGEHIRAVFDLFRERYSKLHVTNVVTTYLTCFSAARDDPHQWCNYASYGRGVCLGIRVLDEPLTSGPHVGTSLVHVDYSEENLRETVATAFKRVRDLMTRTKGSEKNIAQVVGALYRIAASSAIAAKQAQWAPEQEYRNVTIVHADAAITPHERLSNGRTIRYLPVRTRDSANISLAELLVGPNYEDPGAGIDRLHMLLAEAGYAPGCAEYPTISASSAPRC